MALSSTFARPRVRMNASRTTEDEEARARSMIWFLEMKRYYGKSKKSKTKYKVWVHKKSTILCTMYFFSALFLWISLLSSSAHCSDSCSGWHWCGYSLSSNIRIFANPSSNDLAIRSSENSMRRSSQPFQTSHMHQKIWYLPGSDATISYSMGSLSDAFGR